MKYFCDPEERERRRKASVRRWYDKNKDKRQEYNRQYYEENKAKILQRSTEKRMIRRYLSQDEIDQITSFVLHDGDSHVIDDA